MNLEEASELFLENTKSTRNLSELTIKAYVQDLTKLKSIVGLTREVLSINRDDIRNTIRVLFQQGQSAATIKRRIACYKRVFSWLENENFITKSPFSGLDLNIKTPQRLPKNISKHDLRSMRRKAVENLGFDYQEGASWLRISKRKINPITTFLGIELLLTTGLRVSELTKIQVVDFNLDENTIFINGKGDRERRVFITTKAIKGLISHYSILRQRYASNHSNFLINGLGNPVTSQTFRLWVKALSKEAKISRRITPHMYRHSAATQLLEAGVDIRYVQRLLGHQSITTTQLYTHVNDSELFNTIVKANVQRLIL